MIVLDASAAVELLLLVPHSERIAARIADEGASAPHLIDAEVGQVLRRYVRKREMSSRRAQQAIADLLQLRLIRHDHRFILPRAFELRENVTVYDGLYLALAEALGATLLTTDRALVRVPGCKARVEVLGAQ